ncbi:glycerol-3-phosphate dehydrogenase, mitochondrial-like [Camellia sinensis]|uniref:glycerol-3-phosphate dehydrogenase, mitochondrial-like n=1 Tax=Camellia sinensis TaxID=4442 RepID=UPI00103570CE|nr:glycerol-3-phosphate dehydrogenase, mitochondrial-like [Camellia sinensis]XP_028055631.1 glycerol-3-phosphate dehydrogenase, mitochondrial-like [Camellia sinensis]XP_028055632.1 glycerol-3-phosphate dehydrogenase, mitochondrial-like [Camellia sinensis]
MRRFEACLHQHEEHWPACSLMSERHLFLQWGNGARDSGLVPSTNTKPRLKWTQDLHEQFIEAVNQLGGADSTACRCSFCLEWYSPIGNTESISRDHVVCEDYPGFVTITGGKWTTCRSMAEDAVDTAIKSGKHSPTNKCLT